jgi:hypothetical protein
MGSGDKEVGLMNTPKGIVITHVEATDSARVDISLSGLARPLAYRVLRQRDGCGYEIRDPFGAAIDNVASLERAFQIATWLAANARDWANQSFDC